MNANYQYTPDINQTIQGILSMKNAGKNPQQILQMLMQRNPEVNQALETLKNMANGRNPKEFFAQLARQNGLNEENTKQIMAMFGG